VEKLAGLHPKRFMFLRRTFAFLIDLMIVFLVLGLITNIMFADYKEEILDKSFEEYMLQDDLPMPLWMLITYVLIVFVSMFLYFTLMEFKLKQTLGKMLTRIYVKSDTKRLSYLQCVIRNIPKFTFFIHELLLVLFLVDVGYLIFKGKRLFDKWSKTSVK